MEISKELKKAFDEGLQSTSSVNHKKIEVANKLDISFERVKV